MARETDPDSLHLIGRIWRAHGVRGEVKVIPETDAPERFEDLRAVFTGRTPETVERRKITSVRLQPSKRGAIVVIKMEGIGSREDADALRQQSVYAERKDLPPLQEDEYFVHDLVGLEVVSDEGAAVGKVEEVLHLPAQDILVVSREGQEAAMIPAVDEFVLEIDIEQGRIVVRPIEGLL